MRILEYSLTHIQFILYVIVYGISRSSCVLLTATRQVVGRQAGRQAGSIMSQFMANDKLAE